MRLRHAIGLLLAATVVGCFLPRADAQGGDAQTRAASVWRVPLSVAPAPAPGPALRYRLQYDVLDQFTGNAAIGYKEAMLFLRDTASPEDFVHCAAWLNAPLDELPVEQAAALLSRFKRTLDTVERASRYESCDWQLPIREEGFTLMLPHIAEVQRLGQLICLRARVRIAEGDFDAALTDLRTALTLARHTGNSETLIEGFSGIVIASQSLGRLMELVQQPGAPNLYWALSDLLPEPFIRFDQAVRWERSALPWLLPELGALESGPVRPDEFHLGLKRLLSFGSGNPPRTLEINDLDRLKGTLLALADYPRARRALADEGLNRAAVDALPVAEAVSQHLLGVYAYHRDEAYKWVGLPYPQALPGMLNARARLDAAAAEDLLATAVPRLLLPVLPRALVRFAELDRNLAALRCIEAIRMHAASNKGALPRSLDEIAAVPVPEDPVTGRPFAYDLQGETAMLDLPAAPGESADRGRIYEITLLQ